MSNNEKIDQQIEKKMKEDKDLDTTNLVLETLSFYEPMTMEKIILDIDSDQIKNDNDFTKERLDTILVELCKKNIIKLEVIEDQKTWIKVFKHKRSWWKRLLSF